MTNKYTAACVTFMATALLITSYITLGDGEPSRFVPPLMYAVLLLATLAAATLIISYIVLRNAWKEVFNIIKYDNDKNFRNLCEAIIV